jgi:hypothetical protein
MDSSNSLSPSNSTDKTQGIKSPMQEKKTNAQIHNRSNKHALSSSPHHLGPVKRPSHDQSIPIKNKASTHEGVSKGKIASSVYADMGIYQRLVPS